MKGPGTVEDTPGKTRPDLTFGDVRIRVWYLVISGGKTAVR